MKPDQPLIYRNEMKKKEAYTVPSAISDDPTLARSQKVTSQPGITKPSFFQSDIAQADLLALILSVAIAITSGSTSSAFGKVSGFVSTMEFVYAI
jgi:hypothetical protein